MTETLKTVEPPWHSRWERYRSAVTQEFLTNAVGVSSSLAHFGFLSGRK